MHGEHKTRGGKLVVADFEVRDGRLSGVRISGDFFLEPPEALSRVTAAEELVRAKYGTEEWLCSLLERVLFWVRTPSFGEIFGEPGPCLAVSLRSIWLRFCRYCCFSAPA